MPSCVFKRRAQFCVASSLRCCPPTISSVIVDLDDFMRTPFLRREAGSLTNRTVTVRTKRRFRHPRTGGTALLLSTTTELLVIHWVPQQDPESNSQLPCYCHACFSQSLLYQFAAIEPLQLRITARGVSRSLAPEKAQQRIALAWSVHRSAAVRRWSFVRSTSSCNTGLHTAKRRYLF